MSAVTLMIQGATSDAGKSTLAAALCRCLARRGIAVAPFKPQNLALNSAVSVDGGEIGRAQAVQAQACRIPAHSDMNPVLLKPNGDSGAQIIIQGRAIGNFNTGNSQDFKAAARRAVLESHARLAAQYQVIIAEGAGSPAEINLRAGDIANMGFAEAVDCPVVLIADIDRGGVFAHLFGTLQLLSESEQARVAGFVINRFRGNVALLQTGLDWLEQKTGKPVLGVLPFLQGLHLEAEDNLTQESTPAKGKTALSVIVPALPQISNHTDFDPLRLHPQVDFRFIAPDEAPPSADLVILPGSKNSRADLAWLRAQGWEEYLKRHLRYGGKLIGICGGFQMLGKLLVDPSGVEGIPGASAGLGYFDMTTVLETEKQLRNVSGTLALENAALVGYEIHAGVSAGPALERPAAFFDERSDGALSEDGLILGLYIHGLFESTPACDALLRWAGLGAPLTLDYHSLRERDLERLADSVEEHLDMERILVLLGQV